ncbi:MAG: cobalamin-binding protein [Gammaproteobacteria bacterium]|jgi:iron complex transport system substrate-binding protein|nr:cobalamin-binding protein [Gammaproteobacteria bacterium]MDP6617151.1 cobalamin-binding protein [Gammaproteobacteria bacterium]MDP6695360.1 cobalamin-binding protein [Gammaproteobacteria bacterium]MDP7041716.1 cobalamin-binding protein [Gammaproteobacteria bacterium]
MAGSTDAVRILLAAGLFLIAGCQPPGDSLPRRAGGPAERVISLAPHITELVYAAGAGDRLVGVVDYSDYPVEARDVPRIGDSFRIDYEAVNILQPDLVLAWQSGSPDAIVVRLQELGYRVVELEASALDDIAADLQTIGELTGTGKIAAQRAAEFRAQLEKLRGKYADARLVRVFYQIAAEPYFTITGSHTISTAIDMCGGENVFAGMSGLAPSVTLESVIAKNPEAIIASAVSGDESWKRGWQDWDSVEAVARENLYSIDPDLISRPGPRIIEGVAQICAALEETRGKR